jgi:hypothetical protein
MMFPMGEEIGFDTRVLSRLFAENVAAWDPFGV